MRRTLNVHRGLQSSVESRNMPGHFNWYVKTVATEHRHLRSAWPIAHP